MIVIAFLLFAALVLAWLGAPGTRRATKSVSAPVIRASETMEQASAAT
jgi:hypothetical protein